MDILSNQQEQPTATAMHLRAAGPWPGALSLGQDTPPAAQSFRSLGALCPEGKAPAPVCTAHCPHWPWAVNLSVLPAF